MTSGSRPHYPIESTDTEEFDRAEARATVRDMITALRVLAEGDISCRVFSSSPSMGVAINGQR